MTAIKAPTKHSADCAMAFGKPKPATGCPRCIELAAGATPRTWASAYRLKRQTTTGDDIRAHFASARHNDPTHRSYCGPVCTFGEW